MSVLTKHATCNMHLSFKNLNPTPTKNLLSKFQNLYIFTNDLSIESLLHLIFLYFFFQVATYAYLFVLEGFTCCIDSQELINLYDTISLSLSQFFPNKQLLSTIIKLIIFLIIRIYFLKLRDKINNVLIYVKIYHLNFNKFKFYLN